ncbi:hypothetical protein LTR09_005110 [Extremus antarcticus]|uniref:Uncharacterized protein n=1 Tax=Extremus antarcticus TaxID=702011 RepID=A0AAJ0GCJ2_9PEZI|nr:hypothetical protein LTR09_005110 [Extremus antarcticus]
MRQSTIYTSLLAAASSAVAQSVASVAGFSVSSMVPAASSIAASGSSSSSSAVASASAAPSGGAAPGYSTDSVEVILEDDSGASSMTAFQSVLGSAQKPPTGSQGPFTTLEVVVGSTANQALRCQVLDEAGVPIAATRGVNFDVTFSDGDGGIWTFEEPVTVSAVVCDDKFVGKGFDVIAKLSNQQIELGSQTLFKNFVEATTLSPTGSSGPFQTFELIVGVNSNPALRCQINDKRGQPIVALRGENRDTTFSDSDKGPWTFERPQAKVGEIICDPNFVANNQPL